jgi:hypothetical protein
MLNTVFYIGVATLLVGVPSSCQMASVVFSWLGLVFWVGVVTIGVATLDVGFPASCLVASLGSDKIINFVVKMFKLSVWYSLNQCCATFLHSRHIKYCRSVMAAHQPHFAYCGGEMVYGTDWPRQLLINRHQPKNVLFYVYNYPSLLLCHLFWIYSLFEIN